MAKFERPEGNLYEMFRPSENNMVYAKPSGLNAEDYMMPFNVTDSSLSKESLEGPRVVQPQPRYPGEMNANFSRSGQSYSTSEHGNPPELDQRARMPAHPPRIRQRPPISVPSRPHVPPLTETDGCRLCGKKILTQCSCSSKETVCEGGHCYFVDPRTGHVYGKSFPQKQMRPRPKKEQRDDFGNPVSII